MQVNAGETQGVEAEGSTLKRRSVIADLPLVRMLIMLRNNPPSWAFQVEPDQVSAFHLLGKVLHKLFTTRSAPLHVLASSERGTT